MKKVKIVQKFLSKSDANNEAAYQRLNAKKHNILVTKVEIVSAYKLYQINGWFKKNPFKKLGLPMTDCFIVIVHYSSNFCVAIDSKIIGKKIVKAVKSNTVCSSFYIVRFKLDRQIDMSGSILTFGHSLSTATGIQYKHLTTCSKGKNKLSLAIQPLNLQYKIAA